MKIPFLSNKNARPKLELKGTVSKTWDVFFFTASESFLNNGKVECKSRDEAEGSALFTALFELPWVEEAAAEGRALVVKKKKDSPEWETLAPQVAQLVRGLYDKETPYFSEAYLLSQKSRKIEEQKRNVPYEIQHANINTPLGQRIQKVLTERVSPSLAGHGGYADMVDLKDGEVYLYFGGGCQGCSQAAVTVKEGIEKLLLQEFPELHAVKDVTDHTRGKNPYYK